MQPAKLLPLALLSILVWSCDPASEPAKGEVDGRVIAPAVNALTKSAALQAGYGMSREVVPDEGVNPFDTSVTKALAEVGVCDNFIQLINELVQAGPTQGKSLMASERFTKVISCFETEAQGMTGTEDVDVLLGVFDKCFCDGSGSVFAAIAGYAWRAGYTAPKLNLYTAPKVGAFRTPAISGYRAPSLPGYKSPGIK